MKKILFYVGLMLLIAIGFIVWNFLDTDNPELVEDASNSPLPVSDENTLYPDTTSYVATKMGTRMPVRDFLKSPNIDNSFDSEVYMVGAADALTGGVLYEIFYFAMDNTVTISLQNENLSLARQGAENELRSVLGVTDAELCNLEIRVTTPSFVSEELSGRNLGLSFCAGSVEF